MAFFGNKRKDFSIQPPKQSIANGAFSVTDSANIDFTYANNNLTANLTQTGITAGTYGDATHIPILVLDSYGRVTGISTTTFSASGILLQTNGVDNGSQTILNLIAGTNMTITDDGLGNITFDASGGGGGSGTVTSVSAGTGMSFSTITTTGSVAIDTSKVPYLSSGFTTGLLKWNGSAWVFDTSTYLTTISGLNISLLTNDSGYITSSALTPYLTITSAAATYYPLTNPAGYITSAALAPYLTSASAAATYLTILNAASTYYPIPSGTIAQYIRGDGSLASFPSIPSVGNSIQALTGDVTASASSPSQSVSATLATSYKSGSCGAIFTGAGGVISTSEIGYAQIPYNGTITGWIIAAAQSGSCTITVFKDTYANFPPVTPSDNIFTTQPFLLSQQKNQNLSPTFNGSMATVTAGDWIGFTITGVTNLTWVNITLLITKTL